MLIHLYSCSYFKEKDTRSPIARVNDKFLYVEEIQKVLMHSSFSDSVLIAENFIKEWMLKQILLEKAELNLSEEQKDFTKQLEDYKAALLIHTYEQELLKQELDTTISSKEIQEYYSQNKQNFLLPDEAFLIQYVSINKDAPNIKNFKKWFKNIEDSLIHHQIEEYCYNYANELMLESSWIYWDHLQKLILNSISDDIQSKDIAKNKGDMVVYEDSSFYYYIAIFNALKKGEVSPLELYEKNIKMILLNKRKLKFIKNLENSLFNKATANNEAEIFQSDKPSYNN